MSHTRGPWEDAPRSIISGTDGTVVLTTIKDMTPDDRRLIAAAPDLLEALRSCVVLLCFEMKHYNPWWDGSTTPTSLVGVARAAIAKATNGTERGGE